MGPFCLDEKHHWDFDEAPGEVQERASWYNKGNVLLALIRLVCDLVFSQLIFRFFGEKMDKYIGFHTCIFFFLLTFRRRKSIMRKKRRSTIAPWKSFWICLQRKKSRSYRRYLSFAELFLDLQQATHHDYIAERKWHFVEFLRLSSLQSLLDRVSFQWRACCNSFPGLFRKEMCTHLRWSEQGQPRLPHCKPKEQIHSKVTSDEHFRLQRIQQPLEKSGFLSL